MTTTYLINAFSGLGYSLRITSGLPARDLATSHFTRSLLANSLFPENQRRTMGEPILKIGKFRLNCQMAQGLPPDLPRLTCAPKRRRTGETFRYRGEDVERSDACNFQGQLAR